MITASSTLFRYISRQFLVHFAVMLLVLLGLIFIFESIELMRRSANHDDITFGAILSMAALKLPDAGQMLLPFGTLFAAIYTCWKLNRTHELVVIRAAGLSAWQFLAPMVLAALLCGIFATAVLNPVSSILYSRYEQLDRFYFKKDSNLVTVSRTGIWLRQPDPEGYALVHADTFEPAAGRLSHVTVFFFDLADNFVRRIDSPLAELKDGHWDIQQATVNEKETVVKNARKRLSTDLTPRKIEESFAAPETISFWKIPEYIHIMEEAGFPSTRMQIHFQSLLAQPFLFAAMIFLAAAFSLRPPRFGGVGLMITLGVATGFFIFFVESMLHAFGISQKIPAVLAAWTPALVSLLLGTTALLHLEDG